MMTSNPNDLALILNIIIPLALASSSSRDGQCCAPCCSPASVCRPSRVIVTFSRAGFLSLATILGVFGWTMSRRPERGWAYAALTLGVAALPLLPGNYLNAFVDLTNIERDATGSGP